VLSGQFRENVESKSEVTHRSADQCHRHRTQSVITRRPPPNTSDRSAKTKTTNLNFAQGTKVDALRTTTSYFHTVWNAFVQNQDGSMQWIPEQIVGTGEDFHNQVDDRKVKTTLYKVRWMGYDRTGDTWEPIIHLQGYPSISLTKMSISM
jgi:hypothetical protein